MFTPYEAWVNGSSDQVWWQSAEAFGTSSNLSAIGKKERRRTRAICAQRARTLVVRDLTFGLTFDPLTMGNRTGSL